MYHEIKLKKPASNVLQTQRYHCFFLLKKKTKKLFLHAGCLKVLYVPHVIHLLKQYIFQIAIILTWKFTI